MTSKSVLLFYKLMSVDFFSQWCICTFKNQWVLIILYLFRRICTFLAGSHTVHCTFNGQFWHFSGGERHSQICRQRYNPCRWMGKCLFTGKNLVFCYQNCSDLLWEKKNVLKCLILKSNCFSRLRYGKSVSNSWIKKNRDTQLKAHIEICQNQAKYFLPTWMFLLNCTSKRINVILWWITNELWLSI